MCTVLMCHIIGLKVVVLTTSYCPKTAVYSFSHETRNDFAKYTGRITGVIT